MAAPKRRERRQADHPPATALIQPFTQKPASPRTIAITTLLNIAVPFAVAFTVPFAVRVISSVPKTFSLRKNMVMVSVVGAALTLLASNGTAYGQNKTSENSEVSTPETAGPVAIPYPKGLSLPWRTVGLDIEVQAKARKALTASATKIGQAWLNTPKPMTELLKSRPPTLNRQRLTDQILAGTPKNLTPQNSQSEFSVTLEPLWTAKENHFLFMVSVFDSTLGTLLGSSHQTLLRSEWQKLGAGQEDFLAKTGAQLAERAIAKARDNAAAKNDGEARDALHLGLTLGSNVTRADEGSNLVLNLLVEEELAGEFTVVREIGQDFLATIRDALGQKPKLRRPTRVIVTSWSLEKEASNQDEKDQVKDRPKNAGIAANGAWVYRLKAWPLESVFGRSIPYNLNDVSGQGGKSIRDGTLWTFTPDANGPVRFAIDKGFLQFLNAERDSLKLADMPQVAKVDRAWVYLDRGRAWGLKINDRLVAEGAAGGTPIKGHVVRFFGPEAGLKSPRGFPIREGAIVYVRLGQGETKPGQTFRFDPREFPTPYPLSGSSAGK